MHNWQSVAVARVETRSGNVADSVMDENVLTKLIYILHPRMHLAIPQKQLNHGRLTDWRLLKWQANYDNTAGGAWIVGTYEASKFYSNSNRTIPIRFDSKVTSWFEIFESAASAVVPQTTLTVQQKNFKRCAVLFYVYDFLWFYVYSKLYSPSW